VAVSVVIPAFDAEATLGAALDSLAAQTYDAWEAIVVDDGSRDGTPERVRAFSDPRVTVLEREHEGAAAARGVGIAAGSAPLISLIDSDDLWLPGYLEAMGAALDADPDASFAYTDAWYLDDRTRRVRRVSAMGYQRPPEQAPATAAELFALLTERNFIYNAVTVRRSAAEAVGPPDPRLRSMIDWEWWLRLTAAGHRAVRVPGRLAVYRQRPESMSRDRARVLGGQRDLWRVVGEEYDLDPGTRQRLAAQADRFDAELAALDGLPARLRRAGAAAKAALRHRRDYLREPPAELRAAFGDSAFEK
jgi:glycosyltransferase involved in cell wall biosynthesis